MGTNYYARIPGVERELHLGKRSGGWRFVFHVEEGVWESMRDLVQLIETTPEMEVWDEYGRERIPAEWLMMARRWGQGFPPEEEGHVGAEHCWCVGAERKRVHGFVEHTGETMESEGRFSFRWATGEFS